MVPNESHSADPAAAKNQWRKRAREARAQLHAEAPANAAARLADHFVAALGDGGGAVLGQGTVVGAYWPIDSEIDSRPLLRRLHGVGCVCALPVVDAPATALTFRRWWPAMVLDRGLYDIPVPPAGAARVIPDVLVIPLLAFDRQGARLGYGGGFYDRTLEALRRKGHPVIAVGVAYAGQEVAAVPHLAHDEHLDWVVTEKDAHRFDKN